MNICTVDASTGRLTAVGGVPWPHEATSVLVRYVFNGEPKERAFTREQAKLAWQFAQRVEQGTWVPQTNLYPQHGKAEPAAPAGLAPLSPVEP